MRVMGWKNVPMPHRFYHSLPFAPADRPCYNPRHLTLDSQAKAPATFRRSLGLRKTTLGGVGTILRAGIYALVGVVVGKAGDALRISFLLAASWRSVTVY